MASIPPHAERALRALMDECRDRCLWYLRRDYYPETVDEALRVLTALEQHGSRDVFRRAAGIRAWLSPPFSGTSAGL